MKDNIDRILEAIDHPEMFSDEELSMLLNDPDTRELYQLLNRTSNLLTETPQTDIDKEWNRFLASNPGNLKKKPWYFFNHKVAAAVTAIVASIAVVAATIGFTHSLYYNETAEVTDSRYEDNDKESLELFLPASSPQQENNSRQTIVFKDETLEQVLKSVSYYYGVSVAFKNNRTKDLRLYFKWDQSQSLNEILEQLNSFEQISVSLNDKTITVE